jgi:hypothetical protein
VRLGRFGAALCGFGQLGPGLNCSKLPAANLAITVDATPAQLAAWGLPF